MNELPENLERAFQTLDAKAALRAERVDAERVAAQVLERLRAERAPARRSVFPLRVAAPVTARWAALSGAGSTM